MALTAAVRTANRDADAAARSARWSRLGLAAVVLAVAAIRLRLAAMPLERDEGEYAYMGQLILRGDVPYVAAHSMKLPGVYYAYAAVLAVLGQSDVAIRVALLAVNVATILLLYRLGRRLLDGTAAVTAAAAYAVLSLGHTMLGLAANAEHFVILPMVGAMLALVGAGGPQRRQRIAAAGVLLGVAFVMKQHAAAFVAFGMLWTAASGIVERRRAGTVLADVVLFAACAAAPFAVVCAGMYAAGAIGPFWFWTVTYAREYATMVPVAVGVAELRHELARIAASAVSVWALAAVGLTALGWDDRARQRAVFVAAFAAASALAVATGGRVTEHYFLLAMPALALLAGIGASAVAHALASASPTLGASAGLLVALAALVPALAQEWRFLITLPPASVSRAVYGANPFSEAVEIGRYLRAHAAPDDRIAVIGSEPEIYFYARRPAATTYIYMYPLMEPHAFARTMQEDMVAQLEGARPRWIVLVNVPTSWSRRPDSSDLVLSWAERTVNAEFDPVGVVEIGSPTVYRWDDEARDAAPHGPHYVVVFRRRSS